MTQKNVLVFSCDELGQRVAAHLLSETQRLRLIDDDEARVALALQRGFSARRVEYTDDAVLKSLGIGDDVDLVFSLFPDSSRNVFLTLSARSLDPDLKIVTLAEADKTRKLLAAGADTVIDPYNITAKKIFEQITRPLVSEILEKTVFGDTDIAISEVTIPEGSPVCGLTLDDIDLQSRYMVSVLGMLDLELGDKLIFATLGLDHCLDADDVLVAIGPKQELERMRQFIRNS